ncbi:MULTISPECIES: hypothetical protein [unclassified Pseudomonas]|uniref:hypothetical protein n=1 Tax=unclassified Pseudomonas TaxID=196821 RepID=UPI002AC91EF0|nr:MULTISPECIES: hypothetical protein [unclassified Pseudomonas]MEB0043841.1 hypothetical protein [Pseudomonas sp. Dout3]MEB0095221.1 hypothetical protein [Pseudomonas sp. DC1.2]WPX58778.1 hypothetical protein RHM68_24910 [Pseudomonas sp. DC1.2]
MNNFSKSCWMLLLIGASEAHGQTECSLQLSPSTLDYGNYTRDRLQASRTGTDLSFGPRRVHLQVRCPHPQSMAVRFDAPAADLQRYRFGPGTLHLRLMSAQLDGRKVSWLSDTEGAPGETRLRPGERIRPWVEGHILQGQHWQLELEVDADLDHSSARVSDISLFQASGRFQLD